MLGNHERCRDNTQSVLVSLNSTLNIQGMVRISSRILKAIFGQREQIDRKIRKITVLPFYLIVNRSNNELNLYQDKFLLSISSSL